MIPKFRCLETDEPTFRLLRLQCRDLLAAGPESGVRHTSQSHMDKCREALRIARSGGAHLFVTPEYAIPIELIDEMMRHAELQPPGNALWCLGCEGMAWESFLTHIHQWKDKAFVGDKHLETVYPGNFAGFILYVFRSAAEDKLCLVPQLKVQPMREPMFVCEGDGLTRGRHIIVFGNHSPNQLVSIICADAFHRDIKDAAILFPHHEEKKYIVLHPQLNPAPRNKDIAALRNHIFDGTWGRSVLYITANWAAGTQIQLGQDEAHTVRNPWSCIYRRFISLDGEQNWLERLRPVRRNNLKYGLDLAYDTEKKLKVWFAVKQEHLQQLVVTKPYSGGPEITERRGQVEAHKVYVPDAADNGWSEGHVFFQSDLPRELCAEAAEEFAIPEGAYERERDKFFGLCLGHLEEGELSLGEAEKSSRVGTHIDEECEPQRERQADRIVQLIRCLKLGGRLPSQLKKLKGPFRFHVSANSVFNLIPASGNEEAGALAVYVEREREMKPVAEGIFKKIPYSELWLKDKICVFSKNAAGEIVHFPYHYDEFTAPDRVDPISEFTNGGAGIDNGLE
ncbi:hypothetical protein [Paenibacillus hamazuiensis]|uniref:hypothetical protein n=1 Tax=Paenibacillus hamazuiensis TaxID=2936508 RepID=UPI00200E1F15|nr:hypothetical protein [Paenibacillus hamazuiensis]